MATCIKSRRKNWLILGLEKIFGNQTAVGRRIRKLSAVGAIGRVEWAPMA